MVSIKQLTHFEIHLVLLMSLSLITKETRGQNYSMGLYDNPIIYPTDESLIQPSFRSGGAINEDPEYYIPDRIMEEMNEIEDPAELFARYFISNEPDQPYGRKIAVAGFNFGSRVGIPGQHSITPDQLVRSAPDLSGSPEESRTYVTRPHMPLCKPRQTAVEFKPPMAGVLVEPPCIMVPRCGPCCRFGMKCLPVDTETFTYSVQLLKFLSDKQRFTVTGRRNITEVHHKSCRCICDIKPEDCQRMGKNYDGTACKCICKDERYNTFYCSVRGRQWNSDSCTCDCREIDCEEGYFYNKDSCKCDF